MEERKRLCGYYNYTVALTYLGMLTGFAGIAFVMEECYRQAVICLMAAGVCDMFDGTVAATKDRDRREKRFGIQIDSLSDLVCFGVLPALFTYGISGRSYIGLFAGGVYLLCALIRLAYFNVLEEERQQMEAGRRACYVGLPVTMSALIVPVFFVLGKSGLAEAGLILAAALTVMAAAFVLPVRIRKPCLAGKVGILFTGVVEFVILLSGLGMEI